jgi:hypothetical protein
MTTSREQVPAHLQLRSFENIRDAEFSCSSFNDVTMPLYLMLQNRIYRGDIVHQGTAYPGQHAAILDPELWQIVQNKLAVHRQERNVVTSFTVAVSKTYWRQRSKPNHQILRTSSTGGTKLPQ